MDKLKDKALIGLIGIVVVLILLTVKQCEKEPKTRTIVKKEIVYKTDTIVDVQISSPKKVYIYEIDTLRVNDGNFNSKNTNKVNATVYKDTLKVNKTVYKMTPIVANEYDTTLKSDSATANLQIRTTGQLLSVKGVITYPKETKTIETIKTRSKSGLFIYGKSDINLQVPEVGVLYQFKNSVFVSGGVEYNTQLNQSYAKVGLGIRIY